MVKTFKQKNFNNFVWTPLCSRVNIYINFWFQVHFKLSAAWYCCHYLPLVSTTRQQICRRCRWYRWQFATGVLDTGGKFAAGIVDTSSKFATGINNASENGGKICHRCRWYPWQICHRRHWYPRQFCRRCRWHQWQICHRCRWYRWCTLTREYLCEFSKKFETV